MYENGKPVNRHKAKMKHKRKMKDRARPYQSNSWEDFVTHRKLEVLSNLQTAPNDFHYQYLLRRLERDLRDIEAYWKYQSCEHWWNESSGKGSYKGWWQRKCNKEARRYWNKILNEIDEENLEDLDAPTLRRGYHFGSINELY